MSDACTIENAFNLQYELFFQFLTDGMMIREIMEDPLLKNYRFETRCFCNNCFTVCKKQTDKILFSIKETLYDCFI